MEEVTQQPTPLQGRRLFWLIPLPAKKPKQPKAAKTTRAAAVASDADTFYGKAMEWTHRADKVINLILGYLLAIASVLGFMDVLSNGQVLSHVPQAFYVWLAIMGLGVDFQLLLVIGRFPDLLQAVESRTLKFVFILFNLAFLGFLAYMSAIIGAVFTQHVDAGTGTVTDAMTALHIDAHTFVFQRATLATLLLVLMAVDRTLERWRIRAATQSATQTLSKQDVTPLQGESEQVQPAQSDIEKLIIAMQEAQNKQLQVVVEQFTRVTVEAVKESLQQALPEAQAPLQISAPTASKASAPPFERDYGPIIEQLYLNSPMITPEEVVDRIKCSLPTAKKWLERAQANTNNLQITMDLLSKQPQLTDEELAEHLGLKRPASARFWRLKAWEMTRESA